MSAQRAAPACAPRQRALPRALPLLLLLLLSCLRCAGGSLQGAGAGARTRGGLAPPPVSAYGQPRRLLSPRGAGAAGAHAAGDARDAPWATPEHPAAFNTQNRGARRHALATPPTPAAPATWRTSPVLPSGAFVMISAKLQLQSDPLVTAFANGLAQAPLMSAVASLVGLDVSAVAVRSMTFPMLAFILLNGTNTWSGLCTHEVEKIVAKHLGLTTSSWAVKVPYTAETDTAINQTLITVRVDALHGDPVLPAAETASFNAASFPSTTFLDLLNTALATVANAPTVTSFNLVVPAALQVCAEVLLAVGGVPAAPPQERATLVSTALVSAIASTALDLALAPLLPRQTPPLTPTFTTLYGAPTMAFFGPPPPRPPPPKPPSPSPPPTPPPSPSPPPPVPFAPPGPDSPPAPMPSVAARLAAGDEGTIIGLVVGLLIGALLCCIIVNTLINRARIVAKRKLDDEMYKRKVVVQLLAQGRTTPPELVIMREKQAAAAAKLARHAAAAVQKEAVASLQVEGAEGAPEGSESGRKSRGRSRSGSRRAPSRAPSGAPKRG